MRSPGADVLADILDFENRAEAQLFIEFLLENRMLSRSEAEDLHREVERRFPEAA